MKNHLIKKYSWFWSFVLCSVTLISCTEISKEPEDFKLGVVLYSFNKFPLNDAVAKAKSAKINYVEGFSFHELGATFENKRIVDLSTDEIEKLKQLLDINKVIMPSLYADGKSLEEWKQLFVQAEKLGLEFMVGEPDPQFLDDVNQLAGKHNMKFAIHQHAEKLSRYWHPDSAIAAIRGRENLKICADIGHWVRSGLDPVECLKIVEGQILSVHVKDLDSFGNIDAKDVTIGDGIIEYPKIITELKRQDFSGYIFVECEHDWENNLQDVKESVSYIDNLSK